MHINEAQGAWAGVLCSGKGKKRGGEGEQKEANATGPDPLHNPLPPPSNSSVKPQNQTFCVWASRGEWAEV